MSKSGYYDTKNVFNSNNKALILSFYNGQKKLQNRYDQ